MGPSTRTGRLSAAGHAVGQPVYIERFRGDMRSLEEPVRMCVGCRDREVRSVLLRVVAGEVDGAWSVVPDPRRVLSGRGASLHLDPGCLGLAERRRAFPRALRRSGPLDLVALREYVAANGRPREAEARIPGES
jgi:predicted RNA-binding protein YlxR (DUF448 family)